VPLAGRRPECRGEPNGRFSVSPTGSVSVVLCLCLRTFRLAAGVPVATGTMANGNQKVPGDWAGGQSRCYP
jgi:hypothetical protein